MFSFLIGNSSCRYRLLLLSLNIAEHIGLIQKLQAVSLKQKHYHHRPQTKVLEFLVAILAGLPHLQDISLAAHPLDKDQAVAQAWGQAAWAFRSTRKSRKREKEVISCENRGYPKNP